MNWDYMLSPLPEDGPDDRCPCERGDELDGPCPVCDPEGYADFQAPEGIIDMLHLAGHPGREDMILCVDRRSATTRLREYLSAGFKSGRIERGGP